MAFLVDTNVISELRRKTLCDSHVAAWQHGASNQELFISVISMMEIKCGIQRAKGKDAAFANLLEDWYETQVKPAFDGRVLSVDLAVSEHCSNFMRERTRGLADALIATTACVNNLTLATRITADFADCGIRLVNPWSAALSGPLDELPCFVP